MAAMGNTREITVHPPAEAARRLGGISVAQLVAILKARGYEYTELMPESKPWGRGRQVWGMTDDQIAAVALGQRRRHPAPKDEQGQEKPVSPGLKAMGWDGINRISKDTSRLRRKPRAS